MSMAERAASFGSRDQHLESSWNHLSLRFLRRVRGRDRLDVSTRKINLPGLWVEAHGLGVEMSANRSQILVGVGRLLMENVQCSIAVGSEEKPRVRIERCGIHGGSDRKFG